MSAFVYCIDIEIVIISAPLNSRAMILPFLEKGQASSRFERVVPFERSKLTLASTTSGNGAG